TARTAATAPTSRRSPPPRPSTTSWTRGTSTSWTMTATGRSASPFPNGAPLHRLRDLRWRLRRVVARGLRLRRGPLALELRRAVPGEHIAEALEGLDHLRL